ncbi:MAG: hypothetical protein CMF51_02690 [Legionellales bacterium]|nr:hypothetical protein [Legionellales bacterium]
MRNIRHLFYLLTFLSLPIQSACPSSTTLHEQRIIEMSQTLLGAPYQLGPLGEGVPDSIDPQPRNRMDVFDCETFVTTTLARVRAQSSHTPLYWMDALRYTPPHEPSYLMRNHFTSLDWNPNAQALGFIKDITPQVIDAHHASLSRTAYAHIDRGQWLKQQHPHHTFTQHPEHLRPKRSSITYIPLHHWITRAGILNQSLLNQLPAITLVEYVRTNWTPHPTFGTPLLVSHMAFLIHTQAGWMIREASSRMGKVSDTPLLTTLKRLKLTPHLAGLHIESLRAP